MPRRAAPALPFRGVWLLYLGYELAAEIEPTLRLPAPRDAALPIALALRCPAAVVVDHDRDYTLLVAEAGRAELLDVLETDLAAAPASVCAGAIASVIDEDAPADFLDGVARIHEHLCAGDVFQVNLSREWRACCVAESTATELYAALRPQIRHRSPVCCRWTIGRSRVRRRSA